MASSSGEAVIDIGGVIGEAEELYRDVHRHPELSMQEERTAALAARWLADAGFDVTAGVGQTGVVGVLRHGDGPTVMLRADMDALPVQEQTGLDYASEVDGVMHACGHDMHVAWLAAATAALAAHAEAWSGTLLAVFQPAEETAAGARAMIDDGLFDRFPRPDVILGQHVMPAPSGMIGTRDGVITSAADSFEIRMFGRGAVEAVVLGAVTGVGGGALRDVLLGDIPVVLRTGLYAIPALIGATIVVVASENGSHNLIIAIVAAAACFLLRLGGLHFDWSMPKAKVPD